MYFADHLNSECKINADKYNLVFNTEREKGHSSFHTKN